MYDERKISKKHFVRNTLTTILAVVILAGWCNGQEANKVSQDFEVYRDGDIYRVRGQIDGAEVKAGDKANEAIQFAVDSLGDTGGEIVLERGVFELEQPIKLASNIWLRGSGRGTKLKVGKANKAGVGILCSGVYGVEVSNLTVTAGDNNDTVAGIIVDDSGDCKIHDLFCVGFGEYGIWLRNNSFLCDIRGCSLAGNKKANIYLDDLKRGRVGDFIPNMVTDCVIYGGGKGIECNKTVVLNIVGCAVFQTKDVAFYIHDTSNSVLISGCRTFQISSHAVFAENAHEFNISSNIFCWQTGHGIMIKDCQWGCISANNIIDSGSYNPGTKDQATRFSQLPKGIKPHNGITLINSSGYNVSANTVFNWAQGSRMEYGIKEDNKCFKNNIIANNVNYFKEQGVLSEGKESIAADNVCYRTHPHRGKASFPFVQSFQTELMDKFIEQQK